MTQVVAFDVDTEDEAFLMNCSTPIRNCGTPLTPGVKGHLLVHH